MRIRGLPQARISHRGTVNGSSTKKNPAWKRALSVGNSRPDLGKRNIRRSPSQKETKANTKRQGTDMRSRTATDDTIHTPEPVQLLLGAPKTTPHIISTARDDGKWRT
ncbi:MAG: hypothetical protein SFV52_11045 [Saprospiraceae bacterium]|nr:hypothetical protein [Saprospiraceae bacterium]